MLTVLIVTLAQVLGVGAGVGTGVEVEVGTGSAGHVPDLLLAFDTKAMGLSPKHIQSALTLHNEVSFYSRRLTGSTGDQGVSGEMKLLCGPYEESKLIREYLESAEAKEHEYHPVYFSKKENRACYSYHDSNPQRDISTTGTASSLARDITVTPVPHILKIDPSVDFVLNEFKAVSSTRTQNIPSIKQNVPVILEIGLFSGVPGKEGSRMDQDLHNVAYSDIMSTMTRVLNRRDVNEEHFQSFYYTKLPIDGSRDDLISRRHDEYKASFNHAECQELLSSAVVEYLDAHISIAISEDYTSSKVSTDTFSPCLRALTSVASLHSHVSHISAHIPHFTMTDESIEGEVEVVSDSVDWTLAPPATDQNAYVQSGTSEQYPYTIDGLELDGNGYVLGMIDTGIDDLSCFLRDHNTSQITTRTAKGNYGNPITEPFRRKVVQYVAWADDSYRVGRDHGSWCGGASVGKCDNSSSQASAYNGLAKEAQITMFDVDNAGDWLDVPSLYNIALPPAYAAGARIHSNSWGTPGMGSYTSKALDADRFMCEHPDFLFVVAAGNAGRTGYTSIHSPGVSKNALTVGASAAAPHHDSLIYFSGIGYDYDQHMIKPNVVAPGTSLTSAGVRMGNESTSCNIQVMSGTSMATPMVASTSVLVKQYFEEQGLTSGKDRWNTICKSSYRSCPAVSTSVGYVSGPLIKAILMNSGEGMRATTTTSSSVLPVVNLTSPPDRYQGWGQILLANVLPQSPQDSLDLYVADQESLTSFTKRTYYVEVTNSSLPLTVTIVWNDPPNVMWSTKNLLHDLDLIVFLEGSTDYFYGNNIEGDEFNPCERVKIETPTVGVYEVIVVAHALPVYATDDQSYSIVITSHGSVAEERTTIVPVSVKGQPIVEKPNECDLSIDGIVQQMMRFQLEDWQAGTSWNKEPLFSITKNTFVPLKGVDSTQSAQEPAADNVLYNCTFTPNSETQMSSSNRIHQCSVCLEKGSSYSLFLDTDSAFNHSSHLIRVSSQYNNIFLSEYVNHIVLDIDAMGEGNACPSATYSEVEVLMLSNVTDDDYVEYSWHGSAHYTIRHTDGKDYYPSRL